MKGSESYFVLSSYCSVQNNYDNLKPSSDKACDLTISFAHACAWPSPSLLISL